MDAAARETLGEQIRDIDWAELDTLVAGQDEKVDFGAMAARAQSPPHVRADGGGADWSVDDARKRGEEALRAGKVAALIVAGGQGTRLGFDKPKGMYPVGPVSGRTLFQFFADMIAARSEQYGVTIPWYVMVSEPTDAPTREYFEAEDYFGLPRESVIIFRQGTMPAVDAETGKVLLAEPGRIAISPDGHGGTIKALAKSGALEDAEKRGVEVLSYFQVDNPLADVCDPVLIGHHLLAGSELTTQVVRKRYPKERVGNVVSVDGAVQIIEYSDLPDEAAEATGDDGQLKLWAGNIAVHVIDVAFARRMNDSAALPFHRASKKVSHVDGSGKEVNPESPNATKFEKFIFDLLPRAKNAFVVETLPEIGFAPVKNADGAETDTPALAKQAISDLHRSWIEAAGGRVADGATVEINPRVAVDEAAAKGRFGAETTVEGDRFFGEG